MHGILYPSQRLPSKEQRCQRLAMAWAGDWVLKCRQTSLSLYTWQRPSGQRNCTHSTVTGPSIGQGHWWSSPLSNSTLQANLSISTPSFVFSLPAHVPCVFCFTPALCFLKLYVRLAPPHTDWSKRRTTLTLTLSRTHEAAPCAFCDWHIFNEDALVCL